MKKYILESGKKYLEVSLFKVKTGLDEYSSFRRVCTYVFKFFKQVVFCCKFLSASKMFTKVDAIADIHAPISGPVFS